MRQPQVGLAKEPGCVNNTPTTEIELIDVYIIVVLNGQVNVQTGIPKKSYIQITIIITITTMIQNTTQLGPKGSGTIFSPVHLTNDRPCSKEVKGLCSFVGLYVDLISYTATQRWSGTSPSCIDQDCDDGKTNKK